MAIPKIIVLSVVEYDNRVCVDVLLVKFRMVLLANISTCVQNKVRILLYLNAPTVSKRKSKKE